ncbi:hypothetical protein KDK95_02825 [Actinospica sp. MGRD01-02]|uniref:Uncharacterized protein n=1 Tax=Actinospica acidithermotolerans TaxID=2828514 RepID=A0A941IEH2_9ACTN|nr:hypothetical protein [Actinospica acidithermotolerans]MBR7825225.1 hypothetical protein [Actinospica acidithermotolerans]
MDPEITTSVERPTAGSGQIEARLTLSELRGLLREAAAYERAQRPVVVQEAPTRFNTTAHEGVDIHIPPLPPPAEPEIVTVFVDRPHNIWPLLFMVSGCLGLAACAAAAATGSQYALLAFFASVAVWGASAYQLVFNRRG